MKLYPGILFWGAAGLWLAAFGSWSPLHRSSAAALNRKKILLTGICVLLIAAFSCWLMGLSPKWNGTIPDHRDEYERITESFLQGKLYLDIEVDPRLEAMENPYDPFLRADAGAESFWDAAYYNGHYYMYFGVVPVFLAFLPFRLLTGQTLISTDAVRFFTVLYLISESFYFFWLIRTRFKKMTMGQALSLLIVFSFFSLLYVIKLPSLYQVPVVCGMFLETWSLYFFSRAALEKRSENSAMRMACAGSLFGALVFGCKPTIALANLAVIPLVFRFLKERKISPRLIGKMALAALPYLAVGAGLMWYNQARFGSPLEFGQGYQMTIRDQRTLKILDPLNLVKVPVELVNSLFALPKLEMFFPFAGQGWGAFALCPIALYALFTPGNTGDLSRSRQDLRGFFLAVWGAVLLMIIVQATKTPGVWDRYKNDYMWLLSLAAFLVIGAWTELREDVRSFSWKIALACGLCMMPLALNFLVPYDENFTEYYPEALEQIWNAVRLHGI